MQKSLVQMYGVLIATLAVAGLFVTQGHLLGIMNADNALDGLRILLAAWLLYVGFSKNGSRFIRSSLAFVGVLYIGMALFGLISSTVWGLLPHGLTGFDVIFHLITGLLAVLGASSVPRTATHDA